MEKSSKDLFTSFQNNDPAAVKQVFYDHYPRAYKTISRYIKDPAIAEDLTQEVIFNFWNKRNKINLKTSMGAYINRMAINQALMHIRSSKITSDVNVLEVKESVNPLPSEELHARELKDMIIKIVEKLPQQPKIVFKLSRFEQLSHKEIATALNIKEKTVENHMSRALKVLREQLKHILELLLFINIL